MAYQEGDILDYPDGTSRQLKGDQWVVTSAAPEAPVTVPGLGKALGSGALHEGVPAVGGIVGDARDLISSGTSWLDKKAGELLGTTPDESAPGMLDAARAKGWKPSGLAGLIAAAPNSKDIKDKITPLIPEYQPQNQAERFSKSVGGFLPGVALAPEMAAASIPRAISAITRYGAAPGIASQGIREYTPESMSAYKEPMAMAAALISPSLAGKMITPNPATAARREAAGVLSDRGATFTPKQLSGGNLAAESQGLNMPLTGNPLGPAAQNERNISSFGQGAMRHFEDAALPGLGRDVTRAENITPQVRQRVDTAIDNEFNRLTRGQPMPFSQTLSNDLSTAVHDFTLGAKASHTTRPVEMVREIIKEARTGGGALTPRSYQNWRSELSSAANAEGNSPATTRVYSQMRDALDRSMERHIGALNPNDAGAFPRVRGAHENKLIVDKAMSGTDASALSNKLTPENLAGAARSVLGPDRFSMAATPMAEYARSGKHILGPGLPEATTGAVHDWRLALTLAGGALGGGSLGHAVVGGEHGSPLGTMAGAALATLPTMKAFGRGRLMSAPGGQAYLRNQVIPAEMRPGMMRHPADAALMAELLARRERPLEDLPQ